MRRKLAWKKGLWIAAAALSLLTAAATAPSGALADTCTVTTNADSGENSLRWCIENASAEDVVVFDDDYTIELETGQLTIDVALTIDGENHVIAVDGSGASRVFEVADGTSGTVTLRNLTVQNGNNEDWEDFGGGILNKATLALENCTVVQNHDDYYGGGIYSYYDATLSVTNSAISGNSASDGGGIYSDYGATLSVTNSAISDNSASSYGGGIYSQSGTTLSVADSTISGNSASDGAGIYSSSSSFSITGSTICNNEASDSGGGVCGGDFSIENSTVSGNSASEGGGIFLYESTVDITDCTVFGNSCDSANSGGGICLYAWYSSGTVNLGNTILAGNTAGGAVDNVKLREEMSHAYFISQGYNLSDSSEFTAAGGDLLSMDLDHQIKLDDILRDNGGPTLTHALLPGSVAIAMGNSDNDADQRGEARIGEADIGAFEYQGEHSGVAPAMAGADSLTEISGQTLVASDGETTLAELAITAGSGAGGLSVALYQNNCEPACAIGFCWDAYVEGTFTGNLTFHYAGLDLGGRNEAALRLYHYHEDTETWEDMNASVDTDNDTITATGVDQDDFSVYTMDTSPPNLIFLGSFEALYSDNGVALSWETASEIDNAGFRLWRSDEKYGEYACIVEDLIPATGNEVTGASYSWFDAAVSGSSHFYKLEDIDYGGKSTMRPLTARRLDLSLGWNLIDGAEFAGQSPASALSSISGKYQSAWGLSDGQWRTYDPARPEFGDLESFEAGVDYYLYVIEPCELPLP